MQIIYLQQMNPKQIHPNSHKSPRIPLFSHLKEEVKIKIKQYANEHSNLKWIVAYK